MLCAFLFFCFVLEDLKCERHPKETAKWIFAIKKGSVGERTSASIWTDDRFATIIGRFQLQHGNIHFRGNDLLLISMSV